MTLLHSQLIASKMLFGILQSARAKLPSSGNQGLILWIKLKNSPKVFSGTFNPLLVNMYLKTNKNNFLPLDVDCPMISVVYMHLTDQPLLAGLQFTGESLTITWEREREREKIYLSKVPVRGRHLPWTDPVSLWEKQSPGTQVRSRRVPDTTHQKAVWICCNFTSINISDIYTWF